MVSDAPQARKRLHLIDLSQRDYFPGINYLDQPGNMDVDSQASMIIHGINKAFGQADEATRVQMERMFRLILVPFKLVGLTFDEVSQFIASQRFRNAVLLKAYHEGFVTDALLAQWYEINQLPEREQANLMTSILNRVTHFISLAKESAASNIFSQEQTTIDFQEAMDNRHILLCKLPESAGYDTKLLDLLGTMIVDKLIRAGYSRVDQEEEERVPFRVYIDEFARFVSNRDITQGLNEMRKFRVSFVLAHQFLAQLQAKDELLYHAVKANCNVRILFSVDDEDAEVAAKAMFTEFLAQDQILHELETQMLTPRETTRVVTSEADVESYMDAVSDAYGGSRMESSGSVSQMGSGMSVVYGGDGEGNFFLMPDPVSTIESTSQGSAYSSQSGTSEQWMSATTSAQGHSRMVGRSVVPFMEYLIGKQVTSVQFRSYQDKLAKLIHRIVSQDRRNAFIQVGRSAPIPFITAKVEEPPTTHGGFRIALRCAYRDNQSGRTREAIEAERQTRKERMRGILQEYGREALPAAGSVEADFEVLEEGRERDAVVTPIVSTKDVPTPPTRRPGRRNPYR